MSANIKASTDGTQAIIGVGGVDQMTVSNAGVVTANSFVGAISNTNVTATGSTTARTLANRFADVINVKDFGAKGDWDNATQIGTDDTAAIQSALNYAKTTSRCVFIPKGSYLITQIAIPSGLHVYGAGIGGYGSTTNPTSYIYDTTELIQQTGVNDDAIVFDCPIETGSYRLFHIYLHDMIILKIAGSDTIGNGISARQVGTDRNVGSNHCLVNGVAVFERLLIRAFPENGMYFKQGATPMYLNDIDTIFNGGYGIRIDGLNYASNIMMKNIAGDGNTGRSCIRVGCATAEAQISVDGLYSEYRENPHYGNSIGANGAQPYGIEIVDFGSNGTVSVQNATAQSTITNEASKAIIFVNTGLQNTTPKIVFNGIVMGDLSMPLGQKATLLDNRGWDSFNTFTIPSSVCQGVYSLVNTGNSSCVQFSNGHTTFGTGFAKPLVSNQGVQVNGDIPSISLYESDTTLNQKGWYINASGGSLYFRTYSDDLSSNSIFAQVVRSGINVSYFEYLSKLRLSNVSVYADNTAAIAGGLGVGDVYRTSTGQLMIRY